MGGGGGGVAQKKKTEKQPNFSKVMIFIVAAIM